jgi:hypothetical protein
MRIIPIPIEIRSIFPQQYYYTPVIYFQVYNMPLIFLIAQQSQNITIFMVAKLP